MKLIQILAIILLPSCAGMDSFFKSADDILTDDAITVKCDRDCFKNEDTNVHVQVDVINKDVPPATK